MEERRRPGQGGACNLLGARIQRDNKLGTLQSNKYISPVSDRNLLKVNKNLANPSLATGAPPAHCSAATPTHKQCCYNYSEMQLSWWDAIVVSGWWAQVFLYFNANAINMSTLQQHLARTQLNHFTDSKIGKNDSPSPAKVVLGHYRHLGGKYFIDLMFLKHFM